MAISMEVNREYPIDAKVQRLSISLHWVSGGSDVSYSLYEFDDAAAILRILRSHQPSKYGSFIEMKHDNLGDRIIIDLSHPKDVLSLFLKINEKSTAANNTLTDSVVLTVRDVSDYAPSSTLFIAKQRMHSNFKSLLSFILYRKKVILMNESDERIVGEDSVWVLKSIHEPVLVTHLPELDSFCTSTMINSIPVYAKFKRRIFNSIAEICTSLTTHNLLMFKDVFENSEAGQGLGVLPFTQILFHAFIILYPKLETLNESRYFVALLQELFHHIDFNSNGYVSWTEFCDFCLKFSFLSTSRHQADDSTSGKDLNDMLIEYEEDILARDTVLPAINVIAFFYHPETDRIALVQERSQDIHIFHASTFNLHTKCLPQEIRDERNEVIVNARKQNKLMLSQKQLRILVLDVLYISEGMDLLLVFCSDDYTITITKESSMMSRSIYKLQNRILHNLIHSKLCWNASSKTLCSIASNNQIFGWKLDKKIPTFQVNRHTDLITGFISVLDSELFVTCSMDKRIVIWSGYNQRVKGILEGHKRGVRCVFASNELLISGSFDCEGRIWNLTTRECKAILSGHRVSIVAARLMFEGANSEEDVRAFTVDEGGELRCWKVVSDEKFAIAPVLSALQVFKMNNPYVPLSRIRFLCILPDPNMPSGCNGKLAACGAKLLSFKAKRHFKEFSPATWCCYVSQIFLLMTAIEKNIIFYDVSNGSLIHVVKNLWTADLTSYYFERTRARLLYIGCGDGAVFAFCFRSLAILGSVRTGDKEITAIGYYCHHRTFVPVGSSNGNLRLIESVAQHELTLSSYFVLNAFGRGNSSAIGIAGIEVVEDFQLAIVLSATKLWGLWHVFSSSLSFIVEEKAFVIALKVIGHRTLSHIGGTLNITQRLVTLCVSTIKDVRIYTVDGVNNVVSLAFILEDSSCAPHIRTLNAVNFLLPKYDNYDCYDAKLDRSKSNIVVTTEEGTICLWTLCNLVETCEAYHQTFVADNSNTISSKRQCLDSLAQRIQPKHTWKAHADVVICCVVLEESACLATVSNDGYQKLWNLEGSCLGECILPNVSDDMKEKRLRGPRAIKWLYRVVSFPFSEEQSLLADQLVIEYKDRERAKEKGKKALTYRKRLSFEVVIPPTSAPPNERIAIESSPRNASCSAPRLALDPGAAEQETHRRLVLSDALMDPPHENRLAAIDLQSMGNMSFSKSLAVSSLRPKTAAGVARLNQQASLLTANSSCVLERPSTSPSILQSLVLEDSEERASSTIIRGSKVEDPVPLWGFSMPDVVAFSDSSLKSAAYAGLYDYDSNNTLLSYRKKVNLSERTSNLLLRNPKVAAQVKIPKTSELSTAEVSFGAQKFLYKNATAILSKQRPKSKDAARRQITLSRIDEDVKQAKANKMVVVVDPGRTLIDNGILINDEKAEAKDIREMRESYLRMARSTAKVPIELQEGTPLQPFDRDVMHDRVVMVKEATAAEIRREAADEVILSWRPPHRLRVRPSDGRDKLEKKLEVAIRERHSQAASKDRKSSTVIPPPRPLTTRDLLPFYRLSDVEHFLDMFAMVDVDANGALDIHEWISIFTRLDSSLPIHEIISMFDGVDTRMEGLLMLSDMIPMLFNKASREQRRLITQYAQSHFFAFKVFGKHLKLSDIQRLFECYDTCCTGFVPVPLVKERLASMNFPPDIVIEIVDHFLGINNDEFLNLPEFVKIFREYTESE